MNEKKYRVKITIGDAIVEVEGEESGVAKIVDSLKNILQGGRGAGGGIFPPSIAQEDRSSKEAAFHDIRSFFKEKTPGNNLEAAAAVAFYLRYLEDDSAKRETIDVETMMDEFRKADWKLPKVANQLLVDAKKAGYFDAVGTGEYKLNSVGYNLVKYALGENAPLEPKTNKKSRKKRGRK